MKTGCVFLLHIGPASLLTKRQSLKKKKRGGGGKKSDGGKRGEKGDAGYLMKRHKQYPASGNPIPTPRRDSERPNQEG